MYAEDAEGAEERRGTQRKVRALISSAPLCGLCVFCVPF